MRLKPLYFILATLLCGCSVGAVIVPEEIKEATSEYEIDVRESFIDSRNGDNFRMIDPVNGRMGDIVDSLVFTTKSQATDFFARVPDGNRPEWRYEFFSFDTVYLVSKSLVSTKITTYQFSGGTHGTTKYYGINYLPLKGRFIGKNEILDMSKKDKINAAIRRHFDDEGCYTIKPTVDLAATVNLSSKSVIFTYEHYVLGPRSCGSPSVEVPRNEINDCILI